MCTRQCIYHGRVYIMDVCVILCMCVYVLCSKWYTRKSHFNTRAISKSKEMLVNTCSEGVEAKLALENYCMDLKKIIKEAEKSSALDESEKDTLTESVNSAVDWYESNQIMSKVRNVLGVCM